jgi:hypothetical protein
VVEAPSEAKTVVFRAKTVIARETRACCKYAEQVLGKETVLESCIELLLKSRKLEDVVASRNPDASNSRCRTGSGVAALRTTVAFVVPNDIRASVEEDWQNT